MIRVCTLQWDASNVYYTTFYFSASDDFIARINLPVTFGAGESEAFVEVGLIDDNLYETQECFTAVLSLPAGSTDVQIGQQSLAKAIIFDDDGTFGIVIY